MQHRDKIILQKIVKEIDSAIKFLGDISQEIFLQDELLQNAESMIAIKVGEFVKNLTQEFRENHKEVSWKQAAGFRDIIAHKYETLEMENVYLRIKEDFPELKKQIEEILENEQKSVRGGKNVDD